VAVHSPVEVLSRSRRRGMIELSENFRNPFNFRDLRHLLRRRARVIFNT
jgi:hypothetical protein